MNKGDIINLNISKASTLSCFCNFYHPPDLILEGVNHLLDF